VGEWARERSLWAGWVGGAAIAALFRVLPRRVCDFSTALGVGDQGSK
jgi:hypothetical protein